MTLLYDTTTFGFANNENLLDVVEGRSNRPLHTRYGMNLYITSLGKCLAELDTADASLAYGREGYLCWPDL